MLKFTLYVGLNDKDTKTQKINTIEAFKIVNNILLQYTEGATIFEASGIYKHNDNEIVIEKTLRIELIDITEQAITEITKQLKLILNQESILIQKENVKNYFV